MERCYRRRKAVDAAFLHAIIIAYMSHIVKLDHLVRKCQGFFKLRSICLFFRQQYRQTAGIFAALAYLTGVVGFRL